MDAKISDSKGKMMCRDPEYLNGTLKEAELVDPPQFVMAKRVIYGALGGIFLVLGFVIIIWAPWRLMP